MRKPKSTLEIEWAIRRTDAEPKMILRFLPGNPPEPINTQWDAQEAAAKAARNSGEKCHRYEVVFRTVTPWRAQ